MNLKMNNKNNLLYLATFYFGLVLLLYVFISEQGKPFKDGLDVTVFYVGYLTFIGLILWVLKDVSISLSINNDEVVYRKWVYFFIKTENFFIDDVDTIDVGTSLMSGVKLVFELKNGKKRHINLFYFKDVVGDTEDVSLGKYAPSNPKLLLGIKVAKTLSVNSRIKFNTVYLDK